MCEICHLLVTSVFKKLPLYLYNRNNVTLTTRNAELVWKVGTVRKGRRTETVGGRLFRRTQENKIFLRQRFAPLSRKCEIRWCSVDVDTVYTDGPVYNPSLSFIALSPLIFYLVYGQTGDSQTRSPASRVVDRRTIARRCIFIRTLP